MGSAGQGAPVGLTVLELESAPCLDTLADAARRVSMSHPLLHARVERRGWMRPACWVSEPPWDGCALPVLAHGVVESMDGFCEELLATDAEHFFELHLVESEEQFALIARWRHVLFDGRGAELMLREIAAFAADPERPSRPVASWGEPMNSAGTLFSNWRQARPFLSRWNELKSLDFKSPGGAVPKASGPRFRVLRFNPCETRDIQRRADSVGGGIFLLPYFLAVATRAHAAVFRFRGEDALGFQVQTPLQIRRRREAHPIFQNQVGVLPFHLSASEARDLQVAVARLQKQFEESVREGIDGALCVVMGWMRSMPPSIYRKFLEFDTRGQLASFFHSHTGEFLKAVDHIGGAVIRDGWHVPAVSQPPGSGVFFSERKGALTATIAWRDGVYSPAEVDVLEASLRSDLLGEVVER